MAVVGLEENADGENTPAVINKFLEHKIGLNSVNVIQAHRLGKDINNP